MNAKQVIELWKHEVLPCIIKRYGKQDKPARRESFNDFTDTLCKDGMITEELYNKICMPEYFG